MKNAPDIPWLSGPYTVFTGSSVAGMTTVTSDVEANTPCLLCRSLSAFLRLSHRPQAVDCLYLLEQGGRCADTIAVQKAAPPLHRGLAAFTSVAHTRAPELCLLLGFANSGHQGHVLCR